MRFECHPSGGWHIYQKLFAEAVAKHGISIEPGGEFSDEALRNNTEHDGIHFHWIERFWESPSALSRLHGIVGMYRYCRLAKKLGKKIIWTVHNHTSHETSRRIDTFGTRVVTAHADLIITHSNWSRQWIESHCPVGGQVITMLHGNFSEVYHQQASREDVLRRYGLDPAKRTVGVIGAIRPNRGHETAIECVRKLGTDVQLLIAGMANSSDYVESLKARAGNSSGIAIQPGKLTDQEYTDTLAACDIQLLAYTSITTSGAFISAWSLGCPAVVSDLPLFRELMPDNPAAGVIMKGDDRVDAAVKAVKQVLDIPRETCRAAALEQAAKLPWDKTVMPAVEVIKSWQSNATASSATATA